MMPLLLGFTALFGLAIGSFSNVVVYRVPVGDSLTGPSHCRACSSPVRWWHNIPIVSWLALRGRCATCQEPISWRYPVIEATVSVLFVAVAWFVAVTTTTPLPARIAVIVALWWLAAVSVILTMIDLDYRRLPNSIVWPSYLVATGAFLTACALGSPWDGLWRAFISMAVLGGLYGLLRWIRPDGMGGGDVKLAGLLGLYLGWFGWGSLAVGALAGFIFGGLFGVVLLIVGTTGRKSTIAFGPWMIAGAWVGIGFGEQLAAVYLQAAGLA